MNAYRPIPQRLATVPVHVLTLCAEARELVASRRFEDAAELLSPVWQGVGHKPNVTRLKAREAAEVLLLTGALTAHIGRQHNIEGATEEGKNLITSALDRFAELPDPNGEGRALSELGQWYAREKSSEDAEIFLRRALEVLPVSDADDRAEAVMRLVYVTAKEKRHADSLRILREHYDLLNDPRRAQRQLSFRCMFAGVLCSCAAQTGERHEVLTALSEVDEAMLLAEAEGNMAFVAFLQNNAGNVLRLVGRFREAHACLDRAAKIADSLGMTDSRAVINETRARVLFAEGRCAEAIKVIQANIGELNESEQKGLLGESLLCAGEIAACEQCFEDARTYFLRAMKVAQDIGDKWTARDAESRLAAISNIESIRDAQAKTIEWIVRGDGMAKADMFDGRCYVFRATGTWKDGDIVAAETPEGKVIGYIKAVPPISVLIYWAEETIEPEPYLACHVKVKGVLEYE